MTEDSDLTETSWTETVVKQFDVEGRLVEETVTVTTTHRRADEDLPIGMYL